MTIIGQQPRVGMRMSTRAVEYPEHFLDRLELIWGKGFLSPGGAAEVKRIVEGVDLRGKTVLDIGCGTGGPSFVLARDLSATEIVGLDVEEGVLARANANAAAEGLSDRVEFRLIEPGPFPFGDSSFDVVFSKDAMIHIPDKLALFGEILRVLRSGGVFAASDWLGGDETAASPEWARFRELAHLTFVMATATECEASMRTLGFESVTTLDRNAWYAEVCAKEVEQIQGPLQQRILEVVDEATYEHWLKIRRALADAVAVGAIRPTHLRGYKPAAIVRE